MCEYLKDFAPRRSAAAAGFDPDYGYKLLEKDAIKAMIHNSVTAAMDEMDGIDPTWVMWELVDNHKIARQTGNISASNTALKALMQHVDIDAMARQKIDAMLTGDDELVARLQAARARGQQEDSDDGAPSFL